MADLLLGGSGQLGSAFLQLLPEVVAPGRADLDLMNLGELRSKVLAIAPTRIINCAAYTDVDMAEHDEEVATIVNGDAVGLLAATADELGVPFVTFSSDYVFDGIGDEDYTELSHPAPINAYGRSKLAGEEAALRFASTLVVRTSWLISGTHPNFVATILKRALTGPVSVVDDQWGRPTLVDDLAVATIGAVVEGIAGVLHLASSPTTNWFGLARAAVGVAGLSLDRVLACATSESAQVAQRPIRAVLVSERLAAEGLAPLPDWRFGLPRVVERIVAPD